MNIGRLFGFEDGLSTRHVCDFLTDENFKRSYLAGKGTGSWGNADLRWRAYVACWAAEHALRIEGDFVECGVNRGGLSMAVMRYTDFNKTGRAFYLLDTFCGSPHVASVNRNDYDDCYGDVCRNFSEFARVRIIRGVVPETLPSVRSLNVAYLSIDMNNPPPEIAALRYFWPKLSSGAITILDDYAYSEDYRAQKNAFDELSHELGFSVLTMPTGQGLIVKA